MNRGWRPKKSDFSEKSDFCVPGILRRYDRGPETVTISGLGPDSLCLTSVRVGERWIFYTDGIPEAGLSASYLTANDAVIPVRVAFVARVVAAVGHDPVPPERDYAYHFYLPIFQTTE